MSKQVTLTIDDQEVTVEEGTVIVDAAKSIGINIPVFCYHPKMEPVGMCRMCLVEVGRPVRDRETGEFMRDDEGNIKVEFGKNLETACTVPICEGMVVRGMTEKVKRGREAILEFFLTSHPLDCPICDKGGECSLQELSLHHGLGVSRFPYTKKMHLEKHVPLGDLITLDQERCIQCGRCIRFQKNIVDDPVLEFYHRSRHTEIVSCSNPKFDSYWSGNTTDICPVGALTTNDFRFEARIWEMDQSPSICSHCPVGCNLTIDHRREPKSGRREIQRVMPRQNEWVNEIWICDKGRFAHHFTVDENRLTHPLVRSGDGSLRPATWEKALDRAVEGLRAADGELLTLVGGRLANEDLFHLRYLNDGLGGQVALYSTMAGGDLVAQVGLGKGSNLGDLGEGDAILIAASDLEEEAPLWWLRVKAASERGAALIVANPRKTKTDRYANHQIRYAYGEESETVMDLLGGEGEAARAFAEADNAIVFFGSEGLDYARSRVLAQACANLLIKTGHVGRANNGLVGVWPRANTQGAWDMGFRPHQSLPEVLDGKKALYIAAADPVGDGLVEDISDLFVVVQELFLTETAQQADVVFPAKAVTEKAGTFTSGERRVQRFEPVVPARGDVLEDFAIASKVGELLGLEMPNGSAAAVMEQIAKQNPDYADVTLSGLREVKEQWPIIVPKDYAYIGTAYKNTSGLGMQLSPFSERAKVNPGEASLGRQMPEADLVAVPVTRLYDQGSMIRDLDVLQPRLLDPQVFLSPQDAERKGVQEGEMVDFDLGGRTYRLKLSLQDDIPAGTALVPRSLGVPLEGPAGVDISPAGEDR
ncbi:MAG: NADH-quinone oxidoreductase subunit NuoG [Anaerolineales bacterium]